MEDKLGVLLEKLLKSVFMRKERVWPTKRSADKFCAHGVLSKISKSNTVRQRPEHALCQAQQLPLSLLPCSSATWSAVSTGDRSKSL